MEVSTSWEATNCAAAQELPNILCKQNFITTGFTRALQWPLSWATSFQSIPLHLIPFNIVHLSTSWSSQWSLSFWLSHQNPICSPLGSHSCYMSCPSQLPWLDRSNSMDQHSLKSKALERLIWGRLKIKSSWSSFWNRTVNEFTKFSSHLPSLSFSLYISVCTCGQDKHDNSSVCSDFSLLSSVLPCTT
jgi:hypothetical protein